MHVSVWFSICDTVWFNLMTMTLWVRPCLCARFWSELSDVFEALCGSTRYLSWLVTSISWLPWHCTSRGSQNSIMTSHQTGQRWKSDLAEPVILPSSPCRAECSGGCFAKLSGGAWLFRAEWGKVPDLDPIQSLDSFLELRNSGLGTLQHGSHIQHVTH